MGLVNHWCNKHKLLPVTTQEWWKEKDFHYFNTYNKFIDVTSIWNLLPGSGYIIFKSLMLPWAAPPFTHLPATAYTFHVQSNSSCFHLSWCCDPDWLQRMEKSYKADRGLYVCACVLNTAGSKHTKLKHRLKAVRTMNHLHYTAACCCCKKHAK